MTAPVFEHTEVGSILSPRMVAFMDNLERRWKAGDADAAHAEVNEYVNATMEAVADATEFLNDGDTLGPTTLENFLRDVIEDYAGRATHASAKQDVKDALRALDSAQRCYEVLRTLVDILSDPKQLDTVRMAVETLTPKEES